MRRGGDWECRGAGDVGRRGGGNMKRRSAGEWGRRGGFVHCLDAGAVCTGRRLAGRRCARQGRIVRQPSQTERVARRLPHAEAMPFAGMGELSLRGGETNGIVWAGRPHGRPARRRPVRVPEGTVPSEGGRRLSAVARGLSPLGAILLALLLFALGCDGRPAFETVTRVERSPAKPLVDMSNPLRAACAIVRTGESGVPRETAEACARHLAELCYRVAETDFPDTPSDPLFHVVDFVVDGDAAVTTLTDTLSIGVELIPLDRAPDGARAVAGARVTVAGQPPGARLPDTERADRGARLTVAITPAAEDDITEAPDAAGRALARAIYRFLQTAVKEKAPGGASSTTP